MDFATIFNLLADYGAIGIFAGAMVFLVWKIINKVFDMMLDKFNTMHGDLKELTQNCTEVITKNTIASQHHAQVTEELIRTIRQSNANLNAEYQEAELKKNKKKVTHLRIQKSLY